MDKKYVNRVMTEEYIPRIKYWMPTIISVITATATLIWFFFSIINPLENDIIRLKNKDGYFALSPEVVNTKFLIDTDGETLNSKQNIVIKNIIYQLKERKDLVLIIAGYTNNYNSEDQFVKAKKSKIFADNIKKLVIEFGINENRVFCNGYGQNVPLNFPKGEKNNIGLLVVDIFYVMQSATY